MIVIIPAAGIGSRFADPTRPKQYHHLSGQPILQLTIQRLLVSPVVSSIVVAIADNDHWFASLALPETVRSCLGGSTRAESVSNALSFLEPELADMPDAIIAVHDAVRPLFPLSLIEAIATAVDKHPGGAIAGIPVTDTVKQIDPTNPYSAVMIKKTISRERLWLAQTPQAFPMALLCQALSAAKAENALDEITDEASAVERFTDYQPCMVPSVKRNLKITTRDDLQLAEFYCSLGLE